MNEPWTIQKAAKEALQVQDACNGTAVARALHEIGRAFLNTDGYGTDGAQRSAPFRLTLMHMCFLSGVELGIDCGYFTAHDECERLAAGDEA